MALSQQQMSIFDNKEQVLRWKKRMESNHRNQNIARFCRGIKNDADILRSLLNHIASYPFEEFQYRQLKMEQPPADVMPVVQYLLFYGLIFKCGKKNRGYVYRKLFDAEDITIIMDEREKTLKTLLLKQEKFLKELLIEGTHNIHKKESVRKQYLTLAYYYYMKFKGGLSRRNRMKYFYRKQRWASCVGKNSAIYGDIPLTKGQICAVHSFGKKTGIFDVTEASHTDFYKFNQDILNKGVDELKRQIEKNTKWKWN